MTSKGGAKFERLDGSSWLPSGPNATHDTYEIRTVMTGEHFTGVLLECLPDERLPNKSWAGIATATLCSPAWKARSYRPTASPCR